MNDPYLYPNSNTLKNLLGIRDKNKLEIVEADFTSCRLRELAVTLLPGDYSFSHLCQFHKHIFQDLYDWAGMPRNIDIEKEERALGGLSIEYTPFDIIETQGINILEKMTSIKWRELPLKERAILFSDSLAALWKVHPFREGNTRTVITFCCQYYETQGFKINRKLLEHNSGYVRDSLVAANAVFKDLGDLSKKNYLNEIILDAINDHRTIGIKPNRGIEP